MAIPPMPGPRRSRERWSWLIARAVFITLVVASLVLFLANRTAPQLVAAWRAAATDVLAPVLGVLNAPLAGLDAAGDWVGSYLGARDRAERLERDNARLRRLDEQRQLLARENAQLRALLRIADPRTGPVRAARLIGTSGGAHLQSGLLAVGRNGGLAVGQPVRDERGLVGRILEVGQVSARVLLVTDISSRVPVVNVRTGQIAMVGGTNGLMLNFAVLPPSSDVRSGDMFVTSGHDGLFPPGIPVGRIVRTTPGNAVIAPAAAMDRLAHVLVLRTYYDMTAAARILAAERAAAELRAQQEALRLEQARAAAAEDMLPLPAEDAEETDQTATEGAAPPPATAVPPAVSAAAGSVAGDAALPAPPQP